MTLKFISRWFSDALAILAFLLGAGARLCSNTAFAMVLILSSCFQVSWADDPFNLQKKLPENVQLHGFMSQGFFLTNHNNIFGHSDDGITPGLTEIGLNLNYQPRNNLRIAGQGLYRRAGDVDPGSVRLDYGLVDWTMVDYGNTLVGFRIGRVKTPFGLYNETRDVSFTHPTILLPQGIYFDRSRSLWLSSDGGSFYAQHRTDFGNFNFKFNVGMPSSDFKEIKFIALGGNFPTTGNFNPKPSIATQLSYEINGGEYIFAVSYQNLQFRYEPGLGEICQRFGDLACIPNHRTEFQPLLFSAQYNGEKFTITGEYQYRWNTLGRFDKLVPPPRRNGGGEFESESWYVEASYRILPELQATVRYDTYSLNTKDRGGGGAIRFQLPRHVMYAKDWVFGLRWDINPSWMLRGEYHKVHGAAWLPISDNPDPTKLVQDWDLFGLQLSFKF